jgi:hypothetical protein
MGEVGSKWLAQRLYSRPLALKNRYMGQPSSCWIATKPRRYQL